jgi:transketolase N-terminal domain/subunit
MNARPSIIALLLSLASCGDAAGQQYIAFERDFADFRSWPRVAVGSAPLVGHPEGQRYVYRRPTPAALGQGETFATGTILIKTMESGPPESWRVFAMVKRGDGYNLQGTVGWEFFELAIDTHNQVTVVERGVEPGVMYNAQGESEVTCNDCHKYARSTDGVLSGALRP